MTPLGVRARGVSSKLVARAATIGAREPNRLVLVLQHNNDAYPRHLSRAGGRHRPRLHGPAVAIACKQWWVPAGKHSSRRMTGHQHRSMLTYTHHTMPPPSPRRTPAAPSVIVHNRDLRAGELGPAMPPAEAGRVQQPHHGAGWAVAPHSADSAQPQRQSDVRHLATAWPRWYAAVASWPALRASSLLVAR